MGNSVSADTRRSSSSRGTTRSGVHSNGQSNVHAGAMTHMIPDQFVSVDQVTAALHRNGLESCNLIVGIDFTKSNEWSGKRTFGGRCLHAIDNPMVTNPYEDVIQSIGQTLRDFDDDNIIQVYGFGDELTADHSVFTLGKDETVPGYPLEAIHSRYREVVNNVVMAGPTSFAPIINQAVSIVNRTGQYHILVIIADGQVTRSVDIPAHAVSKNEKETIDAIVNASNFPLSIVTVGVGDGPWDSMRYFDDYLVSRRFDNFQFVEFSKIATQAPTHQQKMAQFALHALMEIPDQYNEIKRLGYLSKGPFHFNQNPPQVMVYPAPQPQIPQVSQVYASYAQPVESMPPPVWQQQQSQQSLPDPFLQQSMSSSGLYPTASLSQGPSAPAFGNPGDFGMSGGPDQIPPRPGMPTRQPSRSDVELQRLQETLTCAICEERPKDTVFQCGHETCQYCAGRLAQCPTCREPIQVRIRRYGV